MKKLIIALSLIVGTSQAMPWELGQQIERHEDYAFHGKTMEHLEDDDLKVGNFIGTQNGIDAPFFVVKVVGISPDPKEKNPGSIGTCLTIQPTDDPKRITSVASESALNLNKMIDYSQGLYAKWLLGQTIPNPENYATYEATQQELNTAEPTRLTKRDLVGVKRSSGAHTVGSVLSIFYDANLGGTRGLVAQIELQKEPYLQKEVRVGELLNLQQELGKTS